MCDTIINIPVEVTDVESFTVTVYLVLTGSLIPATFYEDVDDNREIEITKIEFEDGFNEYDTSNFREKVYNHVDKFMTWLFNEAPKHDYLYLPTMRYENENGQK